jgi:hypothetical protein
VPAPSPLDIGSFWIDRIFKERKTENNQTEYYVSFLNFPDTIRVKLFFTLTYTIFSHACTGFLSLFQVSSFLPSIAELVLAFQFRWLV